ncbi:hypothetical protein WMY93_022434 [Mugilogobius chulae]|uniref:Ig-like domain-containing protein n=1 Tax=Mugilogobius chulae TaxID=88201 RepID=A0AAW0NI56_9GOBI
MIQKPTVFLHLTDLRPEDSAVYSCECTNSGGVSQLQLDVFVKVNDTMEETKSYESYGINWNILSPIIIAPVIIVGVILGCIYKRCRRQAEPAIMEEMETYAALQRPTNDLYQTVHRFKRDVDLFLFILFLAFKALDSQITGHGSTSADYGGEAHFKCKLDNSQDVLQVTWQRLYKDNPVENLATYSKRFGEQVNDPYKDKIQITEASLQSSSITVRNLTWADESCYVCSFNAYPSGSKGHQTCLKVQGVSNVKTQLYAYEPENEEVIFSCSATGKPAPKIKWDYSHQSLRWSNPKLQSVQ